MGPQTHDCFEYQEAEYRRLARLLHDDLGQLLAALCMHLQLAADTAQPASQAPSAQCLDIARLAMEQVREVSFELCPSILDHAGLAATLPDYLDRQARRTGLAVNLVVSSSWKPLSSRLESACFRVVQEAVRNVIRHASATQLRVELRQDAEAVHLTVADDGVGFDTDSVPPDTRFPRRFGLAAMRQRVKMLGGDWNLDSAPGQGTTIRVRFPVEFN